MARKLYNHVDVRVRDRARAVAFYDQVLGAMGLERRPPGEAFQTYHVPGDESQWFGFTVDAAMTAGDTRICFEASSRDEVERLAEAARRAGAANLEPAHEAYGSDYYATFFEDPDGNKLEVAFISA